MEKINEIYAWYTWIELAIAAGMMLLVMLRPKMFWPMILVGSIIGQGPRFMGYHFFDELLLGSVVIGALLRIFTFNVRSTPNTRPTQQRMIFFLWIAYMIIESIAGIYLNDDIRIIRWVLFYVMLGLLAWITYHYDDEFPFPSLDSVLRLILLTTLIYNVVHLATGLIYDRILGYTGHYDTQFFLTGFIWSGTGVAVFTAIIAMPVAIIVVNRGGSKLDIFLGWSIIATTMTVGHYYDSRISWVVVFGCFFTTMYRLKAKTVFGIVLIFTILFFTYETEHIKERSKFFFQKLFLSTQALWNDEGKSDICRRLQFEAGLLRLMDSPVNMLIGDGLYSHRHTVVPHIEKLYSLNLPDDNFGFPTGYKEEADMQEHDDNYGSIRIFRTTGFTALLVDTGVVGMSLFILNFLMVAVVLYKQKSGYRLLFMFVLALAFWWLFVVNLLDVTILYLLIMPRGLLERLSEARVKLLEAEAGV